MIRIAVIELKRYIINASIFYIIIFKFSYQKKSSLVILLGVEKSFVVNFYNIILYFNLAISLKIKNC